MSGQLISVSNNYLILACLILLMFSILVPISQAIASPVEDIAADGDAAYKTGDYDKAITAYRRVLNNGQVGDALFFNLGNAYFKKGELGKAILNYERARKLNPRDPDIRFNLEISRERTVDRIERAPRLVIWDWLDNLRDLFPPKLLAWTSWLIAMLAALLFGIAMLLRTSRFYYLLRRVGWVSLSVFSLLITLLLFRVSHEKQPPHAIILQDKVVVRTAPDNAATEAFHLHEGTKVQIVKKLEGFYEIRLIDGRQGWMPAIVCEII